MDQPLGMELALQHFGYFDRWQGLAFQNLDFQNHCHQCNTEGSQLVNFHHPKVESCSEEALKYWGFIPFAFL